MSRLRISDSGFRMRRRALGGKRGSGRTIRTGLTSRAAAFVFRFSYLVFAFGLAGCHTDMWTQPKALPQQASDILPGGQVSQPPVEGTVARGRLRTDEASTTGFKAGKLVKTLPETLSIDGETLSTTRDLKKVILRGRERFTVFCTHCHGQIGDGKGMIAQRGLELRRPPASYHTDRLRQMPIGHFFDVQTNGFGAMYSYASRIEPGDRWAIAAYVRALQLSQHAKVGDVPPGDAPKLESNPSQGGGE